MTKRYSRAAKAALTLFALVSFTGLVPVPTAFAAGRIAEPVSTSVAGPSEWTFRAGVDVGSIVGTAGARVVDVARSAKPSESLRVAGVPVKDGIAADFQLQAFDEFAPDARIVAMADGVETPLPRPTVKLFQGRSLDGVGSMFLAVDGARMQAVITYDGETSYMLPWEHEGLRHVIARSAAMPRVGPDRACDADLLPENEQFLSRWTEAEARPSVTGLVQADVMVDVNNSLFVSKFGGNTTTATNYITTLMGAVTAIYQRDVNVRLRISSMTIWTTADPFSGTSSSAQLGNYVNYCRSNRTGVARDFGHLFLNGSVTNYGGIAYLGVLCDTQFGYGLSNIYATASFPQVGYHWDLDVTSHEMGHNFGSPHTHCYSPPIDMCYSGESGCYTGPVIPTTGTIMSYCHLTSGGKVLVFSSREISVIRSGADSAACLSTIPVTPRDTVGVYTDSSGIYFLRNAQSPGGADVIVGFGPTDAGWTSIAGDWNGDGVDTPGLYASSTGTFFLRNSLTPGPADATFSFGPGGSAWTPIVGDWNGDGIDTVGIYSSASGFFYLKNTNANGGADRAFGFGPAGAGLVAIAGDWNGDGIDTVGLYTPSNGTIFLRNFLSGGPADVVFTFGPSNAGWIPITGDWNGDGRSGIGLYAPSTGTFFLKNALAPGGADMVFSFGPSNFAPLAGNWDGL